MRAAWIVQLLVAGGLLAGAAWALERALLRLGRPARWAWVGGLAALLLATGAPLAPRWSATDRRPEAVPSAPTVDAVPLWLAVALARSEPRTAPAPAGWTPPAALDRLDGWVAPAWGLGTLGMAVWLGAGALLVRRRARRWHPAPVLGPDARVSPDGDGPLVAGVRRPRVVVPAWLLDDPRLPLALAHERSHVAARDPWLLAAAAVAVAVLPWHPAAWWMARRLRVAVELDCDRRVLGPRRAAPTVRAYGALLLDVAARRRALPHPPHAAAGWPLPALAGASALDRRIRTMTAPAPRRPARRALALSAAAMALAAGALALPRPVLRAEPGPVAPADTGRLVPARADTTPPRVVIDSVRGARVEVVALRPATAAPSAVPGPTRVVVSELRPAAVSGDTLPVRVEADSSGRVTVTRGKGPFVATTQGGMAFDSALVIIDGVDRGRGMSLVNALDPNRIATVDVLKGEMAAQQYGARGRHGVVRIVTNAEAAKAAATRGPLGHGRRAPMDSVLVIIDGRERGRGQAALGDLKAEQIESMDVIKGDSVSARYGAAGRHGVIRIVTKRDSTRSAPATPRDSTGRPVRGIVRIF